MGVKTKIGIVNSTTPDDIRDKALYDLCVPSNAGKLLAFDASGELTAIAPLTVDAAMSSSSTNPVQNKVINAAITNLQSQITALDPNTKTITVTQSTQTALTGFVSIGHDDASISGSYSVPNTESGVAGGAYTLKALLQELVNKSHSHTNHTGSFCNCNCDCTCSGG